jgi:hypothetical protein
MCQNINQFIFNSIFVSEQPNIPLSNTTVVERWINWWFKLVLMTLLWKLLMSFWWMGFDFKVMNEQGLRIVLSNPTHPCHVPLLFLCNSIYAMQWQQTNAILFYVGHLGFVCFKRNREERIREERKWRERATFSCLMQQRNKEERLNYGGVHHFCSSSLISEERKGKDNFLLLFQ